MDTYCGHDHPPSTCRTASTIPMTHHSAPPYLPTYLPHDLPVYLSTHLPISHHPPAPPLSIHTLTTHLSAPPVMLHPPAPSPRSHLSYHSSSLLTASHQPRHAPPYRLCLIIHLPHHSTLVITHHAPTPPSISTHYPTTTLLTNHHLPSSYSCTHHLPTT